MKKLKRVVQDTQNTVDDMLEMTGDRNSFLRMQLRSIRINTVVTLYMINAAEAAAARVTAAKDAAITAIRQRLQDTK